MTEEDILVFIICSGVLQNGSTRQLTRSEMGAYVSLLVALYKKTPLSFKEIQEIIDDDTILDSLTDKFAIYPGLIDMDDNGNFFNKRLRLAIQISEPHNQN